ncbi:MAG: hypothetical protein H6680_08515 [Desulfobacteraceae bacterium]|nr:hypothetical protein [Desulfobacteraceae bacterium]
MNLLSKLLKKSTTLLSILFFLFGIYSLVKAYSITNPFFFIIVFFSSSFIILLSLAIFIASIFIAKGQKKIEPTDF